VHVMALGNPAQLCRRDAVGIHCMERHIQAYKSMCTNLDGVARELESLPNRMQMSVTEQCKYISLTSNKEFLKSF